MKKILLVDDDPDLVEMNKAVLENNNFEVLTAHNTKEGMEVIKKSSPDLLVLDVMMDTDWEGLEALSDIRKIPGKENMPIIMLTSFSKHYETAWGKEGPDKEFVNVNVYIEKPVSPERLLEEVKKLLN
jgi:two-component system, OmpR family, alkaline phosphatase synthesis response regulator PhoP